jgi:hypothetical protein
MKHRPETPLNATYVAHEHSIRNVSEHRKYYELKGSFLGHYHKKHKFKYHSPKKKEKKKKKKILNTVKSIIALK